MSRISTGSTARAAFLMAAMLSLATAFAQSSEPTAKPVASSAGAQIAPLPDSPGTLRYQIAAANEPATAPQVSTSPSTNAQKQAPVQQPVGTAAAESIQSSGVAASAPAGAAIAPAKQRQTRSLLIKMGAVLGAGAALGTVAALSTASPSRPPGAH